LAPVALLGGLNLVALMALGPARFALRLGREGLGRYFQNPPRYFVMRWILSFFHLTRGPRKCIRASSYSPPAGWKEHIPGLQTYSRFNRAIHREELMITLVQFDGPGPFQTPPVKSYLGAIAGPKTQLVHIQLALEDGRELYVPLANSAFERLCRQFYDQHILNQQK
jgi:hypothetical protein